MTRATLYAVRLMPQIFNFCFHIIYIQSQDFDICFFSFHDCWDYWQNGLAKSERAIVAMTTAVIAMAVTNTSIDSRSIVSIIILLIFFVAKISGIKRLYNQNLTETEKSASQPSESAFETKAEVSVHLLPNSRLHADTTGRCRKCTPESFVRSCQKCASLRNPDLGEGVAYRHYHVDLPRLPSVALFQGDIQFVRTFGRHDDFAPLVFELHKSEILAVNHQVFALRFVLDGGNPPAFVIFHRHDGRASLRRNGYFPTVRLDRIPIAVLTGTCYCRCRDCK